MPDYPYILVTGKLKNFLQHIQTAGVPSKVTNSYLASVGYKSSNDSKIVPVLKFIGFLDSLGTPTSSYRDYRDKYRAPLVLGIAIRNAYSELFSLYPDANQKDSEALRNFLSSKTNQGESVLSAIVLTFQALCSIAKFDELPPTGQSSATPPKSSDTRGQQKSHGLQSININIQLTLPETTNSAVFEEIFKAMKKYLLGSGD